MHLDSSNVSLNAKKKEPKDKKPKETKEPTPKIVIKTKKSKKEEEPALHAKPLSPSP